MNESQRKRKLSALERKWIDAYRKVRKYRKLMEAAQRIQADIEQQIKEV